MQVPRFHIWRHERATRRVWPRARLAWALVAVALGISGCGGGSKVAYVAPRTTQSSSTTVLAAASKHSARGAASHSRSAAPATKQTKHATKALASNGTQVDPSNTHPTIAGPQPLSCLTSAGLMSARAAPEPGVWEANAPNSNLNDRNEMVFVDGPYTTAQAAWHAANSLLGTEYAAHGGRYEISASLPSHLSASVAKVAACLAGGASSPSNSSKTGSGSGSGSSKAKSPKSKSKSYSF